MPSAFPISIPHSSFIKLRAYLLNLQSYRLYVAYISVSLNVVNNTQASVRHTHTLTPSTHSSIKMVNQCLVPCQNRWMMLPGVECCSKLKLRSSPIAFAPFSAGTLSRSLSLSLSLSFLFLPSLSLDLHVCKMSFLSLVSIEIMQCSLSLFGLCVCA